MTEINFCRESVICHCLWPFPPSFLKSLWNIPLKIIKGLFLMVADQSSLSTAPEDSEEHLEPHGALVIHLLWAGKIDGFVLQRKMFFLIHAINIPVLEQCSPLRSRKYLAHLNCKNVVFFVEIQIGLWPQYPITSNKNHSFKQIDFSVS